MQVVVCMQSLHATLRQNVRHCSQKQASIEMYTAQSIKNKVRLLQESKQPAIENNWFLAHICKHAVWQHIRLIRSIRHTFLHSFKKTNKNKKNSSLSFFTFSSTNTFWEMKSKTCFFFCLFCRIKLKLKGVVWPLPSTAKVKPHTATSEKSCKVYSKQILACSKWEK